MKKDIILAGVGGQGILSIAAIIGYAAVTKGLYLKQAEVHGMSQRGGDVSSNLRLSDKVIYSDLIPKGRADIIISVEPMESLRYLPMLSPDGWIISNTHPFVNINNYPDKAIVIAEIEKQKHFVAFDADKTALEMGASKSANIVILGAASPYLGMEYSLLEDGIKFIFKYKGDKIIEQNLNALKTGREIAEKSK
jgi:indolepyruvate ferredoxin oxidoreductase, beta subunit